jgi:hypothetical protein
MGAFYLWSYLRTLRDVRRASRLSGVQPKAHNVVSVMGQNKKRTHAMKRIAKITLGLLMCGGVAGAVATPASARVAVGIGIGPGYDGAPYPPAYNPNCDPRNPYYEPYYCDDYGYDGPDYYGCGPFVGFDGFYGGGFRGGFHGGGGFHRGGGGGHGSGGGHGGRGHH